MSATIWPSSEYVPEVGVSRQPITFMRVDLPEPDGPMTAAYSPRPMSMETPSSAWTSAAPMT